MAHMMPPPPGRMPSSQRKMQNGPKMGSFKRPMKSSNKKVATSTHTGDVVSDESDPAAEEGGSIAIEDDDEADAYALSGAKRGGSMASARLAGLSNKRAQAFGDDQAVTGAEREGSDAGSDDYDYGVVEDVSESESEAADDDERSIRKAAERDLVAEFERLEDARPQTANSMSNQMTGLTIDQDAALARRLSLQSEDSNLEELDFSQDPFAGLPTNDSLYLELFNEADNAWKSDNLSSWRDPDANLNRENSVQSNGNEKKVRFVETPASSRSSSMSSEDEDDPRNSYPDLFDEVDDNMSRSQFLMEIEMAVDDDNESTYDYESFTEQYETGAFGIDQEDSDSESEMSDSTDDGETTDEEDADEQLARVRAMQRRNGTTPVRTPASTPGPSAPSTPVTGGGKRPSVARLNTQNRKPKTGTFKHDPTRASIMADTKGSGVKLVCPTNPPEQEEAYWERARQAMGSRDGSPGGSVSWTRPTPRASTGPKRPLTAKSTLGTMFDGNLDFLRDNDECGIAAELTMPSRTSSLRSSFTSTNTPEEDEDSDDSSNIHMEDFVQMSDSDSEMDEPLTSAITSPTGDSNALGHLQQRGLVSSFRNNQHLARQVSSLPAHPTQRAQTSEANALQKGRRGAANTPMTPARKKNLIQDLAHTGAGVKKASASPLIQKHRRSRGNSLSQTLAIDRFSDANCTQ